MAAILLILALIIFVIYHKIILFSGLFSARFGGINDIINMYLPFRDFFAQSIRGGQFPLWATDMYLGFPLHAEGQGGYFYPPNIFFAIFPSWIAYNCVFILNIFLTGLFSFLLAKSFNFKKTTSLLFSIVFTFSGFFAVHNEHMNLLNSAMWIPLVFLFIFKISRKNSWIILGLIFAIQFFSGFPQIAYYSIIVGFIWLIFLTRKLQLLGKYFFSIILCLLLAASQIIPTIELIPYSARAGGIVKSQLNSWGYFLKDILTFVNPYIFGNPTEGTYIRKDSIYGENCAFIGIMALFLVIYGFIKNLKNRNIRFFSILSFSIMVFILLFPKIFNFLFILPGMQYFRLPQRALVFVALSLSFIAASGFQELKRFKILIFLVILIELVNFSFGYNKSINIKYLSKPETVKLLNNDSNLFRISVKDEKLKAWLHSYYFSMIPELREKVQLMYRNYLPPNVNMLYNISSINAYSPLVPEVSTNFDNVKYIISSSELKNDLLIKKLSFNNYLPDLRIYKKKEFYPRAFIISDNKISAANIKKYESIKTVIENNNAKNGDLILCDFYYPGWNVFIDGIKGKILEYEKIRSVKITSNNKKVIFVYMPLSFYFGIIISIIMGTVLFILLGNQGTMQNRKL
ncbi:MAG: hypothetical protein A2474_00525 [Elusimicrobia bacterium RIFOXYC2_FULL_34_12]|nr:MAG: hypothetical protein A2474_00525 [Elusimicrobia bacterium RIFOXYC2_FULL_34_12]